MFITDKETLISRKDHVCTWCGKKILKGEQYFKWKSVDDSWFTSKVHQECHHSMLEEAAYWGDYDYMPFSNSRPEREQNEILQS